MEPHQQRVVDEKTALDARLAALRTFLGGDIFNNLPNPEQSRLTRQAGVMQEYSDILAERIAAF